MQLRSFSQGPLLLLAVISLCAVPAMAQSPQENGKLKIHVSKTGIRIRRWKSHSRRQPDNRVGRRNAQRRRL